MALPTLSDITLYVNKVLTGKDWNKNFQAILKWFTDGTTDIKVKSIDIPATGNITNAGTLVQSGASQFGADVAITGNLTASGNITADKFIGDGSLLTNLVASGLANYTPFTVNSGNVDANGDGEILSFEVSTPKTLNFKVGTPFANLIATRADSITFTLTEISDVDVASLTNGTYTICVLKDVIIPEVCGTVYYSKIAPLAPQQNDVWLDISGELIKSYKYDTGVFVPYNGVPIGTVTVNTGVCTAVTTIRFNYNGYNVNKKNDCVVVETYSSGTNWYRVWSDGWVEQGGESAGLWERTNTTQNVTFLIPFSNTNYCVQTTAISGNDTAVWTASAIAKTATGFSLHTFNQNEGAIKTANWIAKGYKA